jgi:CxxC motif-containing protein (DUF1111 family)
MKAAGCALIILSTVNALGSAQCPNPTKLGDPLPGLTAEELSRFEKGRVIFERKFTPETGLGPLFNADACAECHEDPVAGGTGDEVEVHVGSFGSVLLAGARGEGADMRGGAADAGAVCNSLIEEGGPVIQQEATPALQAALGIEREPLPTSGTQADRSTPDVFGFGLLDAVPDRAILARADPNDRNRDGISGRPNRFVDGRLGRFGRKAFVPTLREFNQGALVIEQGITNSGAPQEESIGGKPIPAGVDPAPDPELSAEETSLLDDFVRFLAPPAQLPLDREGEHGRVIFGTVGCASCHVPSLMTGDHPIAALRYRHVEAYSDLLLHDMGEERADICFGLATPSEFRTEPLMGLRFMTAFLHDGQAKTIEQAIDMHGGEATAARKRFQRLKPPERAAVLRFLSSL